MSEPNAQAEYDWSIDDIIRFRLFEVKSAIISLRTLEEEKNIKLQKNQSDLVRNLEKMIKEYEEVNE